MRRDTSSVLPGLVLPGLVLAVLVAALALVAAPAATAAPGQLPESAVTAAAPLPHDEGTVHRGTAGAAHPLPVQQWPLTVAVRSPGVASPQLIGIGLGPGQAAEPGAGATSTVQGRAPPVPVR